MTVRRECENRKKSDPEKLEKRIFRKDTPERMTQKVSSASQRKLTDLGFRENP